MDVRGIGAGAFLSQVDAAGMDHQVKTFSRKLNSYQVKHSEFEREALALVWSFQHFDVN